MEEGAEAKTALTLDNILLPEYELVMESADELATLLTGFSSSEEDENAVEDRRLREYRSLIRSGPPILQRIATAELEKYAKSTIKEDHVFCKFRKVCAREPEQVIRYYRNGGEPLWIAKMEHDIAIQLMDIPACPNCQSSRKFEFQVMPQLLNFFEEDDIDWGTVIIFTCPNSCDISVESSYCEEHIIKQDV